LTGFGKLKKVPIGPGVMRSLPLSALERRWSVRIVFMTLTDQKLTCWVGFCDRLCDQSR
jgi:hypothetical protein